MPGFAKRWLGTEPSAPVTPFVPEGRRIYCIGDIHGRFDLLQALHEKILEDGTGYPGLKTAVYLGDYIDRGEQSKEVIEVLIAAPLEGFDHVYLLGNHEQSLLDFLDHPRDVGAWLTWGGRETAYSYGVPVPAMASRQQLEGIRDALESNLPTSHLEFLTSLTFMHQSGNYCFVHAGIRPGIPIQQQRNEDLLWIRDDFTQSKAIHEKIIVHGHTITQEVEQYPNRIGIDTGAYASGILTCLVLEGSEQRVLQTVGGRHAGDD